MPFDSEANIENEERLARSPLGILYRQIDRFFMLRVAGRGAEDALRGVLSCVSSVRDTEYESDLKQIKLDGGSEWDVIEAIFRLLKRKNLWLQPPQALTRGSELLSGVE